MFGFNLSSLNTSVGETFKSVSSQHSSEARRVQRSSFERYKGADAKTDASADAAAAFQAFRDVRTREAMDAKCHEATRAADAVMQQKPRTASLVTGQGADDLRDEIGARLIHMVKYLSAQARAEAAEKKRGGTRPPTWNDLYTLAIYKTFEAAAPESPLHQITKDDITTSVNHGAAGAKSSLKKLEETLKGMPAWQRKQ